MHSILRINIGQGKVSHCGKKSAKVSFLNYNSGDEKDRHQRGVQRRRQRKREKEKDKQYRKQMALVVNPQLVYAALLNPTHVIGLNTFAANNRSFRTTLFAFFCDVVALPNANINPQQANALGILNALIAANVPFHTIIGDPNIIDGLDMMGALRGFRFFLGTNVSDSSDHDHDGGGGGDDDDSKHDEDDKHDDGKKDVGKKRGGSNFGNTGSSAGNKLQKT